MNWKLKPDDEDIASIRVTKRTREKLGILITGNETLNTGLERILDVLIEDL